MLDSLTFTSYKRFAATETLRIAPITLLIGKNSSGKSSLLKLFPMLEYSLSGKLREGALRFENNGVSLGTALSDMITDGNNAGLRFKLDFSTGLTLEVTLFSSKKSGEDAIISEYEAQYGDKKLTLHIEKEGDKFFYRCLQTGDVFDAESFSGFVNGQVLTLLGYPVESLAAEVTVDYIGPVRVQPQRVYSSTGAGVVGKVGLKGEPAYEMLASSPDLLKKVSGWYSENFNGVTLVLKALVKGMYELKMQKKGSEYQVNIADEGQGMSQVLPIVARCLLAQPGLIVPMEQPELHLHPAAHLSLARLFAATAKTNRHNYIIETHSENILLGIREAVVDESNPLQPEDVAIYFIDDETDGSAYIMPIEIYPDGTLSDWPTGVFNEAYDILKSIKTKALSKNQER